MYFIAVRIDYWSVFTAFCIYCIDTKNGNIDMWSLGDKKCSLAYKDFFEYLIDRMNDAIENM